MKSKNKVIKSILACVFFCASLYSIIELSEPYNFFIFATLFYLAGILLINKKNK